MLLQQADPVRPAAPDLSPWRSAAKVPVKETGNDLVHGSHRLIFIAAALTPGSPGPDALESERFPSVTFAVDTSPSPPDAKRMA